MLPKKKNKYILKGYIIYLIIRLIIYLNRIINFIDIINIFYNPIYEYLFKELIWKLKYGTMNFHF